MEYNAIIREYSGNSLKIIGHSLLTDLKNGCPKEWVINYCSKPLDRQTISIEELCCGPTNPLQIYKPAENAFPIFIRNVFGNSIEIMVSETDTVKALKWKIFQKTESCHPFYLKLYINQNDHEKKLKDAYPLTHYGIHEGSSVFLKQNPECISRIDYQAINLEATYARIASKLDSPSWARYSAGINFCGSCPNRDCISGNLGMELVIKMGYGATRVSLSESKFSCPACNDCLIFPDKFLVACARSLIRYRREEDEQVRCQLIESPEHGNQFQEIFLGHPYLIEIITVEPWRSPYCCVKCDTKILFKNQEYKMSCGHMYHKLCKPSSFMKKCAVCKSLKFNEFGITN